MRPPRILVTKIGLDGHDRGSRVVAAFLRDAGCDVIYTPPWQSSDDVIALAVQEDVDVIGISSLSTDHLIVPDLMAALASQHVRVIVGGIVPQEEHALLFEAGGSAIFGPGASSESICARVKELAVEARRSSGGETIHKEP